MTTLVPFNLALPRDVDPNFRPRTTARLFNVDDPAGMVALESRQALQRSR
jgi:glutamyl-tRNA reductase